MGRIINMCNKIARFFLVAFTVMVIQGCASDKIVKTYDGAVISSQEVAVLTAPENITLLSVNDKDVPQYLLSNLETKYGLKPGENIVVFKYNSIWSKAKKDQETGARVDVVESLPLEVKIQAMPGKLYTFSYLPADNLGEAKVLAETFVAKVIDQNKNMIAESVPLNTYKQEKAQQLALEQAELLAKKEKNVSIANNEAQTITDKLKALWSKANADEKKAFLVWAFQ